MRHRNFCSGWFAFILVIIALIMFSLAVVGYVLNIYRLTNTSFDPLTPIAVIRCLGVIVAPVGSILGWIP